MSEYGHMGGQKGVPVTDVSQELPFAYCVGPGGCIIRMGKTTQDSMALAEAVDDVSLGNIFETIAQEDELAKLGKE